MRHKDEIVEEVRAAREAYAARFNFDLAKIYDALKAKEQARGNIADSGPSILNQLRQLQSSAGLRRLITIRALDDGPKEIPAK